MNLSDYEQEESRRYLEQVGRNDFLGCFILLLMMIISGVIGFILGKLWR